MKKQEYNDLKEKAIGLIFDAMEGREELMYPFEPAIFELRELPYNKEIAKTMKGIIGFHIYLNEKKLEYNDFLFNALHDVYECIRNYKEDWYSPRLSRFVNYKAKEQ